MSAVVASAAAAAEQLPIPLDGGKVSIRKRGRAEQRTEKSGARALTAGALATNAAPAEHKSAARRAPKNTPQAGARTPTAEAAGQPAKRARSRPARADDQKPSTSTQEPSAGGRTFRTLARVAVIIPPKESAGERASLPDSAAEAAGNGEARQSQAQPAPSVPAAAQREHAEEAGADAPTPPASAVPRAPRPTVALRRTPTTKRLSAEDLLTEREEHPSVSLPPASVSEQMSRPMELRAFRLGRSIHAARGTHPRPLADAELVVPVAGLHAAVATGAALIGAALLIAGQSGAFWLLALTVIAGGGGWLAYALDTRRQTRWVASYVLLASQLGALAWVLALIGPRAAVLMLAPLPLLLGLRIAGRTAATVAAGGALALYAIALALALLGDWRPEIATTGNAALLLDAALVSVGLLGTLAGMLALRTRQARAEATARARLYELRVQRSRAVELRQQTEDDADTLAAALAEALRGKGIEPTRARGALSPLAEQVMAVAERLETLQQDREDRVRMDAALRAVVREVERAWLGLPWVWPRASGTPLDELVALLRAPRPQDAQALWPRETPTLLTLPTIDTAPLPRVLPPGPGIGSGTYSRPSAPDLAHFPRRAAALPWGEWDEWRGWNPTEQRDGA